MRLNLHEFNIKSIEPNSVILIIGKRGSGKSVLLEDILYHHRYRFDVGLAMTATEDAAARMRKHMPNALVYEDGIEMKTLTKAKDLFKECEHQGKKRQSLAVFDDCMADKEMKGKTVTSFFYNGRHYGTTIIVTMQYCMNIGSDMRGQFDYVFVFHDPVAANRERLRKHYFGVFSHQDDFDKAFRSCTENYDCMVLDSKQKSTDISKSVFWYHASLNHPPFRLFRMIYWKLSKKYCKKTKGRNAAMLKPRWYVDGNGENQMFVENQDNVDDENPRVQAVVRRSQRHRPVTHVGPYPVAF